MATLTTSYQKIAEKYIGTVSGSGVAAKDIYLRIYAKYNSQSIANNTSAVSYKSVLYVSGSGTYFYTGATTTKSLSGTGVTAKSGDASGDYYLGETALYESTGTVTHGSSGNASVSVTASWNSAPWGVSGSVTGSADLPLIARATTPTISATSITMGGSATITMTAANSSFKHKLRYNFGNVKGSANGFSIGADFTTQGTSTATFTPPASLGSSIPNSTSGSCEIVCYTYLADGTHIGTSAIYVTLSVPSYTPSITGFTLTGNNLLSGNYVQGKSTVKVTANLATQYGATTKSISATVDGKTYTALPFITSALSAGSKTVKITYTDSRNKSVTVESAAFTVYAYAAPSITEFSLARQSDGTTVIATVKGSIAPVNNVNAKTVRVTIGSSSIPKLAASYSVNETITFTGVPTDNTLAAKCELIDSFNASNPAKKDAVLPTVAVTMDFHKSGKGASFGKVAEKENTLDVAWDINAGGKLTTEKDAFVGGDLSVGGGFTLGGNDLLNYAKSTYGWGKNTVLYNAQTVSNSYGNTINGASVNLEANSTYLVLVGVMVSDGAQTAFSDILLANVESGGNILISCSGRAGAYAGGGVTGFGIVKTTAATYVRCQSHGYKNGTFSLYMRTVAIKLDT